MPTTVVVIKKGIIETGIFSLLSWLKVLTRRDAARRANKCGSGTGLETYISLFFVVFNVLKCCSYVYH